MPYTRKNWDKSHTGSVPAFYRFATVASSKKPS